jgi:hypothetical protein
MPAVDISLIPSTTVACLLVKLYGNRICAHFAPWIGLTPASRRFKFQKSSQHFLRAHNETLSGVAVRVNNPHRSPFGINRGDAAPTPTGFAEFVRGLSDCC